MNTRSISHYISLACLTLAALTSFYFYQRFPPVVATHWGLQGNPDGFSSRAFAAFFFPILNIAIYLLLTFIPRIDPLRERYQEFAKTYSVFKLAIVAFLTILYFLVGLNGIGRTVPIAVVVPALVGVLFIILGNYMGKIKNNWFFGIRTPWTLSSELVWNKTHRLSGRLFVLGGLLMLVSLLFPAAVKFSLFIAVVVIASLIPIAYSYVEYRKLQSK